MSKLRIGIALAVLCALLSGAALASIPSPPPSNVNTYVFDMTSGLITSEDRQIIDERARELEYLTGAQGVVVLVSFLGGEDVDIYAHDLYNAWGISANGFLLLLAQGERDVYIAVGHSIEHMLPAAAADRILGDVAVPKLAVGDYSGGLREAFLAATDRLAQAYGVSLAETGSAPPQANAGGDFFQDIFGGIFGTSNSDDSYRYEYSSDSGNTRANSNNSGGGSWVGTLVIIVILYFVLGGGRRRRYGMGGGSGCLPFLLGGFLGRSMGRNRGPYRGPTSRPPTGGFRPPTGGFKPGGFKPGSGGFKPGSGGGSRGGGAGRKF